jgi:adenylate cyclase
LGSITAIAVAVVVLALYYFPTGLLERFEATSYDLRFKASGGSAEPEHGIAIVAIDEKSIKDFGRFPWPRERFAQMLDYASSSGARAILLDVFFPEESEPSRDLALQRAVADSGVVTLTVAIEFALDGETGGIVRNLPAFEDSAKALAHINAFPDADGIIRWGRLVIPYGGKDFPSLGLRAAAESLGAEGFETEPFGVVLGGKRIPTDSEHQMLINYTGPPGIFKRYSFSDVATGRIPPEELNDKVLLVGATALGIYDMRATPYSNNTPGVEIHANIAANIMKGNFIERGGFEAVLDMFFIVVLSLVGGLSTIRLRPVAALPLVLVLIIGYLGFAHWMFLRGSWLSVVYPLAAAGLSYAVAAYLRFNYLDRRANRIRSMFSSYVSPKIVDELVKSPEAARIGGDSRVVTVLFADIRNYTRYSERRSPAEVVSILNEYLAEMTGVIMDYEGTLDKFMGDGILAYWGAPLPQENHAELAVRCSFKMLERLGRLHKKWLASGAEPLECGIGINSGEVIAGNIGAEGKKMEYTVIGDNVNLAHRIQSESRRAGAPVITEDTYDRVRHLVEVEPMGEVALKGKVLQVEIYALKGIR